MGRTPDRSPGTRQEERIRLTSDEGLTADLAGEMVFDGTSFSFRDNTGPFNPRAGGGGISESEHEALDTLVHALAEERETVVTRSSGKVAEVLEQTTDVTPLAIRKTELTRTSGKVTQVLIRQYDDSGNELTSLRMTGTVNRSSGKVSSIDWALGT